MSGRREFVPRRRLGRNLAPIFAAWLAGAAAAAPHVAGAIEPQVFARAYLPGEPVRLYVVADRDVTSVNGEFLGKPLTFTAVPRDTGDTGDTGWIAWGVIPLDTPAGPGAYRLTAAKASTVAQSSDGTIAIAAKSFPEQRLTVESKFVNPPKSAAERIAREQKRLNAIYARRTPLAPTAAPFVKPVPGDPTSEFGTHRFFNGEPRAPHPGIDLHADTGTPVAVSGPGRVALAANLYYSGGTVIVDHGGGLFTIYAHLSKIEAKEGATVAAGDRVGLSGATGRVTGPHLHWGGRVGGEIFDPRALLDPRLFGN